MRAIWKGSISFSLVTIPVSLYPAIRKETPSFRLLRARDFSPISYKRVAEGDGQSVPWDQIVKGYEYKRGRFVVLTDEDLRRVHVEATQTVNISDFVKLEEIDPMFFDKPYYLEPQKGGEKAYALLRRVLEGSGKVGIAKVVIKTRQHLAALKPRGKALVLELMHYADELLEPAGLRLPGDEGIQEKELKMAMALVDSMSDSWNPRKYRDDYRSSLLDLIGQKIKLGGKLPPGVPAPERPPTNVIDLVSVLEESLANTKKSREPKEKKAPAARSSKKAA